MGIMSAEQEEHDGYSEEELLRWCILIPVVDLLPHVEVVVGAGVEIKRDPSHVVEHQIRAEHVRDVGQRPGCLL